MTNSTFESITPPIVIEADAVSKRVQRAQGHLFEGAHRHPGACRPARTARTYWALSDVSIDIHAGTTIGLIGHNGSGKSTLLKVVGGIIQPTSGRCGSAAGSRPSSNSAPGSTPT